MPTVKDFVCVCVVGVGGGGGEGAEGGGGGYTTNKTTVTSLYSLDLTQN